jgi:hypothetical protein
MTSDYRPPSGSYRLIVLQPDVAVGRITTGGIFDQHEDWTQQARANILAALERNQSARGGDLRIAATPEEAGWDKAAVEDLILLHRQVGLAIRTRGVLPFRGLQPSNKVLPSKEKRFDWTLGEQAVAFGAATHYDYALFLRAEDSFTSSGRAALEIVGLLGCLARVCIAVPGGHQIAFASLVDLKTGEVVWFNQLLSPSGDIRTPDGAGKMIDKLLETMNNPAPADTTGGYTHR